MSYCDKDERLSINSQLENIFIINNTIFIYIIIQLQNINESICEHTQYYPQPKNLLTALLRLWNKLITILEQSNVNKLQYNCGIQDAQVSPC